MAVTEAQLREVAEKLFTEMDTNKNGKLEPNEVRKFTEQTTKAYKPNEPFDEAEYEATFQKLDKNQDGTVDKDELFASLMEKARESGTLAEGQ